MSDRPSFTVGIEEEYLVVDRGTLELVREPVPAFLADCKVSLGDQVTNEYLQCQIEVGTQPHRSVPDAVAELRAMRRDVAKAAEAHGYAVIAAATHPFSHWRSQSHTKKERYDGLRKDLGQTVQRLLICGMHVHVCIEEEDLRIDLMNQAVYFLPYILALSCSSPYWGGDDTGLASYRLTVFDALPRTGLPDEMNSFNEYLRLVDHLVHAGCIEDATKIWWDIRPSARFPTVEQRVADACSKIEDTAAIAAFYQSLMAYLYRLKGRNQRWRIYSRTILMENRWRAQRYGINEPLVDHGRTSMVPFADLIEELMDLLLPEAEMLGCRSELLHMRRILADGTSADRQRAAHAAAIAGGADAQGAMRAVAAQLADEFCPTQTLS